MRFFTYIFILYVVLNLSGLAFSQIQGNIMGHVYDEESKELLTGANIQIEGTLLGSSSDRDGYFEINKIPPGLYNLNVRYIGFKSKMIEIKITARSTLELSIHLQPTAIEIEQIIITGSRQPEKLASAASSVNVLNSYDIQRRNNFRLDEALTTIPGVALVGESINIRGGSGYNRLGGSRVLVLLDEVPILTSDLGNANWNILPLSEIEHIEVLKGAASSLYGSGALSGVVNIITKLPSRGHSVSFKQSSGFYDEPSVPEWKWTDKTLYFNRTDASYSKSVGPLGFRLAVSRHSSTGDRENGEFNRWYFTGKTRWQINEKSTLSAFSTYSFEDRELFLQWMEQNSALLVPPTERGDRVKLTGFLGYIIYNKLYSPTLSTKFRVSYNQQLVGLPFNISNSFTPAIGLSSEAQVNWQPHKAHSLSMGVDYKHDMVESEFYGKQSANGVSPYIQEIWKISNLLQLNAGLRFDTYTLVSDSIETQLSPKIGFSFQPVYGSVIHFSFGRGFRAATAVERFISAGSKDFRALPNPDLEPERSTLFDFGFRQQIRHNVYAEVAVFSSNYKNLIEPTLNSDLTAQFINQPEARIQGIETELRWKLWRDHVNVQASASWMDPKEVDTGEPLLYRPRFIGYFSPAFTLGPFQFEVDYRYMSKIDRVAIYPLDEQVPTKVWDVRWKYNWQNLTFQAAIKNAANYNYTISERVLGEIRHIIFSVSGDL